MYIPAYINIYKEKKKKHKRIAKKKKKNVAIVATVPLAIVITVQNLGKKKVAHETKAM